MTPIPIDFIVFALGYHLFINIVNIFLGIAIGESKSRSRMLVLRLSAFDVLMPALSANGLSSDSHCLHPHGLTDPAAVIWRKIGAIVIPTDSRAVICTKTGSYLLI